MDRIDLDALTDIELYERILEINAKAKGYLEGFAWCKGVLKSWYDFGIYDKIGVFLFQIDPATNDVDEFIWVIAGDIPSVYIDQSITTGQDALRVYCDLMNEWATNICQGKSVSECYPILADPTIEHAEMLKQRIAFIEKELLVVNK